jgi:hypothetical protein
VKTNDVVLPSGNPKQLLMYYDVMTMTIIVVTASCVSLKEKKDDRCDQS